jgi:hypothetical protein
MNPKVNTLGQDIKATNAINAYREAHGLAKVRNPYAWWVYAAVYLTYFPKGITAGNIRSGLDELGIQTNPGLSYQLQLFANQTERNVVQRNYTKNLPGIAQTIGLRSANKPTAEIKGPRQVRTFFLKDTRLGRQVLLTNFPHTTELFSYLDAKLK